MFLGFSKAILVSIIYIIVSPHGYVNILFPLFFHAENNRSFGFSFAMCVLSFPSSLALHHTHIPLYNTIQQQRKVHEPHALKNPPPRLLRSMLRRVYKIAARRGDRAVRLLL